MELFKASNSNEQAGSSQSPVRRRRPLAMIANDESPSSPRSFYKCVIWDTRTTPLRMRKSPPKRAPPPQVNPIFKRHKSSPQFIQFDKEEPRDLEEEQRKLEEFRNLMMQGLPPRNLMADLNENLNDSVNEGPLIKDTENEEMLKKVTENEPGNDSFLSSSEIARLEADALLRLEEMEREDQKQSQVESVKVAPVMPKKSVPLIHQLPKRKVLQVAPKFSDDFDLDSEEIARIEAEGLKQLKAEEFEAMSQIASEDFRVKPMASSTQFSPASIRSSAGSAHSSSSKKTQIETQLDSSDIDEDEINRMFAEGEKLLKQQEEQELSQVEKKFEECFTNPRATSTQVELSAPRAKPPVVIPSSTSSTLSQVDREKIERNKREAMRRREIYQQNQRRVRKN